MTAPRRQADITVALATRNRPEMVDRCLRSLLALTVTPREIVITDQSLDQQTAAVVARYAAGDVELVYQRQAAQGLGTAQNLAMARARASVVAVTDDDCVPALDWVSAIDKAMNAADAADVVTGPVLPFGPERPGTYPVSSRTRATRAEFDHHALPWEIGSGNNFAVRRAWLEQIGANDERLGPGSPGQGGVDMDLFYRLARAGARIHYEPAALVYHERVSQQSRLARRGPYGYGMGACCSLWLRQGDRNALRVLGHWSVLRVRRLALGLRQRDGLRIREEALVLAGTVGGLWYGWKAGRQPRKPTGGSQARQRTPSP